MRLYGSVTNNSEPGKQTLQSDSKHPVTNTQHQVINFSSQVETCNYEAIMKNIENV